MKILAFGASNSKHSINRKFATYATTFFEEADIEILDLNDFEMPIFSIDLETTNGHPDRAKEFLKLIRETDLLIISMAEHNGSYTTAFKNILDWASRVNGKIFNDTPMLLLATAPGPRGGTSVLEAAKKRFPFHAGHIIETFSLPEFNKHFDDKAGITQSELRARFDECILNVKKFFFQPTD